jgi:hypothetical protein
MESDDGFRSFSRAIESDPIGVLLAKWRRDAFIEKLQRLPDVAEVIPSGSLTRGTQTEHIHDVDLIVVFKRSDHPDYGSERESAQAAMQHLQEGLREQLHPWRGAEPGLLDDTELRTRVVKCLGGWTERFAEVIPSAPPVDVMPAVREGAHLLIPERGKGWTAADPEKLMRQVAQREREWEYFTEVVKMVKAWAERNHLGMKNLAIEVMVLKYCPRPGMFETLSCGEAVARFFENAAKANITSLKDPAGRCGEIDPGMNYMKWMKLQAALSSAAGLARQAMDAEHEWKHRFHATRDVTHPDEFWRKLFGKKYPRARKRFWRASATEPWHKEKVESPRKAGAGDLGRDWPGRWRPGNRPPDDPGGGGPDNPGGGGPDRPGRDPDEPNVGPFGPGDGPRPAGGGPDRFDGPGRDGHGQRPGPATPSEPAEPGTSLWTEVFGPAAVTVSVPLTFG